MQATSNMWNEAVTKFNEGMQESMKAGLRVQEEAARFFRDTLIKPAEDRGGFDRLAEFARENSDRMVKFLDEQTRRTMELTRKGLDLGTARDAAEYSEKLGAFWRNSFDAATEAFEAVNKLTGDAFTTFSESMQSAVAGPKTKARTGRK